ncbi:MAG: hypothetical protein ACI819_002846, partial [Neolewinella sp.]
KPPAGCWSELISEAAWKMFLSAAAHLSELMVVFAPPARRFRYHAFN